MEREDGAYDATGKMCVGEKEGNEYTERRT